MSKLFASRYIVDVEMASAYIVLRDSSKSEYFIDVKKENLSMQFKDWFKNVFSKGISQLTVIQYSNMEKDGEILHIVDKILTTTVTNKTF